MTRPSEMTARGSMVSRSSAPVFVSSLLQPLCRFVLQPDLVRQAFHPRHTLGDRTSVLEPCSHDCVGQPSLVTDESTLDLPGLDRAVGAHRKRNDDRHPVLIGVQRGQVRRQALREHRENARRSIDGSGVVLRVRVQGRAFGHEGVDIGDGDVNSQNAAIQALATVN